MRSNEEVVLAVFRAVEERDREALFDLYHDDVELHDAPSLPYGYEGICGKEAMREQLESTPERSWLGTWGPLQPRNAERRMDPRVVAARGDEVVIKYTTAPWLRTASDSSPRYSASTRCEMASSPARRCSITTRLRSSSSSSEPGAPSASEPPSPPDQRWEMVRPVGLGDDHLRHG